MNQGEVHKSEVVEGEAVEDEAVEEVVEEIFTKDDMNALEPAPPEESKGGDLILLFSMFLIAICALIYELVAGAVSSYLLGSSVTHFSLVIGLFLSAMGVGSYLTRFISGELLERFVQIELMIGLIGGSSSLLLFSAFTYAEELYMWVMVLVAGAIGVLVGMELPIIIRVLEERRGALKLNVANVMTVDYLGALAASLAFPLILVPLLGLMRTAFAFGLLNVAVAWVGIVKFRTSLQSPRALKLSASLITLALCAGFYTSGTLVSWMESDLYPDEVIYAKTTSFQRVVLTHWKRDTRLFLNGALQFSSVDEHRYHEALVHPAMRRAPARRDVLILGGGDGLAAREVLKYSGVRRVDLVDIDPALTELFSTRPPLLELNQSSLRDPRLRLHHRDAAKFLRESDEAWDVILIDLPDPESLDLGRLYSLEHFTELSRHMRPHSVLSIQSTSPFYSRSAFWCIAQTLAETPTLGARGEGRLAIRPYHLHVPSFGEWGFVLASPNAELLKTPQIPLPETRFLDEASERALFIFPKDLTPPKPAVKVNRLNTQPLVQYYREGFRMFYGDRP